MTNKTLAELKQNLQPYLFFWEEWCTDENCNLDPEDVELVNAYLSTSFKIGLIESFLFHNRARAIKKVIGKLEIGHQVFKDVVIVKFLFSIITIAKQHDYRKFLETPISQLPVSPSLKTVLLAFKGYTLQQLFIIYKAEDFGRPQIFKKIVAFHQLLKEETLVTH